MALLVGTELWGFITPANVDLSYVLSATAKVQPYYAVPSQYLAVNDFPTTKNGKVDKRALIAIAQGDNTPGQKRLSVRNGGIPFSPTLPGTPNTILEPQSYKWGRSGAESPSSSDTLSVSSRYDNSKDTQYSSEQEDNDTEDAPVTHYVHEDVPRIVCMEVA